MIKVGDALPEANLHETTEFGEACPISPKAVQVSAAAAGKKIVIFGVPGAYTPTCSGKHLPGFVEKLGALQARGVDEVWCVSVNDAYVMAAWGREHEAIGKVRMLGDGSADFTKKLGLEQDLTRGGMGVRSQRYSLYVDNGVVKQINVEKPGTFEASSAETMLSQLG